MVGQERALLPLLARSVFGLTTFTSTITFLVAFGATKAVLKALAGWLSDRVGRKPVLVTGCVLRAALGDDAFNSSSSTGRTWWRRSNQGFSGGLCSSPSRRRGASAALSSRPGYDDSSSTPLRSEDRLELATERGRVCRYGLARSVGAAGEDWGLA
jgi:hypothetical protein